MLIEKINLKIKEDNLIENRVILRVVDKFVKNKYSTTFLLQ